MILENIKDYQTYKAISYSKLSMADRAPWEIPMVKQPPGPAMLFGSAVDLLLQPGNKFEEEFVVLDFILPEKTTILGKLLNTLYIMGDMSRESVEIALNSVGAKQLKLEAAIEQVEPWKEKFDILNEAKASEKKIISTEQYIQDQQIVSTLL